MTIPNQSSFLLTTTFSADGRFLFTASEDGLMKLWRADSGELLASTIAFNENDWIVFTPNGSFDGSPAASHRIIWRFNNNTLDYAPGEKFAKDFFHAGLLSEILSGKTLKVP